MEFIVFLAIVGAIGLVAFAFIANYFHRIGI